MKNNWISPIIFLYKKRVKKLFYYSLVVSFASTV